MKRNEIPIVQCLACGGRGATPSDKVGEILRKEREERDVPRISKTEPSIGLAHNMGLSESYILDLEGGKRPLSWALIDRYREAIERAVSARLAKEEVTTLQ